MLNINKAIIAGNLGEDPEVRDTNGTKVCTIRVATTRVRGKGDDRKEYTEWHRVVLWGQNADYAGKYLHKGDSVYAEGYLTTRKWQDREGNDQYTTEIVAEDFQGVTPRQRDNT